MNKINLANKIKDTSSSLTKDFAEGLKTKEKKDGIDFLDLIKEEITKTNALQKNADHMATDLASGKKQNIHETMLSISHAELNFNLMVQVRNKALEAYQEIMRMPV